MLQISLEFWERFGTSLRHSVVRMILKRSTVFSATSAMSFHEFQANLPRMRFSLTFIQTPC